MKVFTVILLTTVSLAAFLHFRGVPAAAPRDARISGGTEATFQPGLISRLKAAGWTDASAQAVVNLNSDRYVWLHESAPVVLEREIAGYEALRPEGTVVPFLERYPEMAGILLLARDPAAVADGILNCDQEEDRLRIIGSFAKYTDAADVSRWAAAVARHGRCVAGLLRRCPAWPVDALFVVPASDSVVAEEYGHWLEEVLDPATLPTSDDEAISLIEFILAAGPEVRRRMGADDKFRAAFRSVVWPAFSRCVRRSGAEARDRTAWELFSTTPHVWELMRRPDGEALFQRAGLLAADLLYGPNAVLPELREKAAQLLLLGNQKLVDRAFGGSWSRHPHFRRLMIERHLSDERLLAACHKLAVEADPEPLLARWNRLSDSALAEDVGPAPEGALTMVPGFAIYYAGKKLLQGRAVGWMDAAGVAGDAFTLVTLGSGKLLTESGKQASYAAVRQKLRQEAVKDIARLTTRELAQQAGEKELGSFITHHALRLLPAELKDRLLKSAVVDVTPLVRDGFRIAERAGIGRESFKKITQLEARIFMRQDAKVCVSLPSVAAGNHPAARFLNATALNGAFDAAVRAQPVQDGAVLAMRVAHDETQRWRQHLACWWAGHATGAFDSSKDKL